MRLPWFRKKAEPGLIGLPPPTEGFRLSEQIIPGWLWILGVLGAALVGLAIAMDLVWSVTNILPDVSLNIGVGILLFAVLFWLQRRILRQSTLLWASELEEWAARVGQSPDELRAHLEGPVAAVHDFIRAILDDADYNKAWRLADPNWRLCRTQAWLSSNQNHPIVTAFDRDEAAQGLAEVDSGHELWPSFAQTELDQFTEVWSDPDLRSYGAASATREVEDGEIVLLIDLAEHPDGAVARAPTRIEGVPFLVRRIEGRWMVANIVGDHAPVAGWPPDWRPGWTYWDIFLQGSA